MGAGWSAGYWFCGLWLEEWLRGDVWCGVLVVRWGGWGGGGSAVYGGEYVRSSNLLDTGMLLTTCLLVSS